VTVRYRITFGKDGPLRYASHLDLARTWERTLRRMNVPLVYSQGFNPRPKLQLAAALPLGCSSTCEVLDVWVEDGALLPARMKDGLPRFTPPGLSVLQVEVVDVKAPALQSLVCAASYHAVLDPLPEPRLLEQAIEAVWVAKTLPRERRRKPYDLRPLIHALEYEPPTLKMVLALTSQGAGRPDEVLDALGLDAARVSVVRVGLHLATDGAPPE
jgi:radical SAM-linked protein